MRCYWCSIVSGDLKLKEHEAARWPNKASIDSVDWLLADLEIIPLIKNVL